VRECRGKVYRELLIEKNAHRRERRAGKLERRNRLIALHGWDLAKELVKGRPLRRPPYG
jgi:hypothetical protein